ncbi:MAG: DUF4954 family protein [Rikenellaceae bacterium]|nr:DUF4954 family protein [Rikenellaceae bacterium]
MRNSYRKLSSAETAQLTANGCSAADWGRIYVKETTDPGSIRMCRFSGEVRIGRCGGTVTDPNGVVRRTGIYNSTLIDTTVGDDCLIENTGTYLANCDIGDRVIIENTGTLACTGGATFGNGTEVSSINEAGGREVPISNGLSAQAAYIMALYRHRPAAVEALARLIADYCDGVRSDRCTVGDGAVISGCGNIVDVCIGPGAVIKGAAELSNGTVNSTAEEPALIGTGVIAKNFICMEGSHMTDAVSVDHCFIGAACRLENGFMSTHSLFFSNSELGGGEAASIFGGPYTVSHHRSSLLIAGYFLFFNAGSGSNQSNHLFKAGAVHQGIHERGCKFGSNSYIMLPSREGAFTVVIGKHTSHHDTSDLPYSYLIEDAGKSSLHPAANLRSYGTHRDLQKWPARDRRLVNRTDRINQSEHNPYLAVKVSRALEICRRLASREGVETHSYNRVRIKNVVLKRGIQLYELALDAAVGTILAEGREREVLPCGEWVDAAGMYLPRTEMERILDMLEEGRFGTVAALETELDSIHNSYRDHAYAWALAELAKITGREPSPEDIGAAIERGRAASESLTAMRTEDAQRDRDTLMETGYGIDSTDPEERKRDFRSVRKL